MLRLAEDLASARQQGGWKSGVVALRQQQQPVTAETSTFCCEATVWAAQQQRTGKLSPGNIAADRNKRIFRVAARIANMIDNQLDWSPN